MLIDTGEGRPEWIESLQSVLKKENITIDKVLLSHWHFDHIQGVADLKEYSPNTSVYKNNTNEAWPDMSAYVADPKVQEKDTNDWLNITDGQIFSTEGATLRAFYCPGHTTDHMAFILEEEDAMFTADNVLGQGTAVFEDLATYMKSLDSMSKQFKGRAYPGHGPVIEDGPAKILEYITHRKQREKQVLDVIAQDNKESWASMEMVKVIYKDYPEGLWIPAEKGVLQILDKLQKEGKIVHDKEKKTWSLSHKSSL